jgi:hypothetical protein
MLVQLEKAASMTAFIFNSCTKLVQQAPSYVLHHWFVVFIKKIDWN